MRDKTAPFHRQNLYLYFILPGFVSLWQMTMLVVYTDTRLDITFYAECVRVVSGVVALGCLLCPGQALGSEGSS